MEGLSISGNSCRTTSSEPLHLPPIGKSKSSEGKRRTDTPPSTETPPPVVPLEARTDKRASVMRRATVWTPEVENCFRYQLAGYRDAHEYASYFPEPEYWDCGLVKSLRAKKSGFFMYFRRSRECEDKHLIKIKIYEYV